MVNQIPAAGATPPGVHSRSWMSRADRKRRSILEAARAAFLSQGFASASMDQVAAEAGVSKATVYAKFGSKQELFGAIVDDICEQILAIEIVIPETAESIHQGLTQLAVNYARVLYEPDVLALVRLAIGESLARPDLGRLYNVAGPQRARRGLVELFIDLDARGELRIADPQLAADQFLALLQPQRYYVLLDEAAHPTAEDIDDVARRGVEVFLAYYA